MARQVWRVGLLVGVAALGWAAWVPCAPPAAAVPAASWSWPVAGVVTRPFAPPAHRWNAGHRGVDLRGTPGVPVRAAGAGQVSYSGLLAGRSVLVVRHGALRTTYEPVSATVGLGAVVAEGDVIGTLDAGHAGCPAPACLHWGLRRGEDYLDPLRLVEPAPVRLLPTGDGPGPARGSVAADPLRDDGAGRGVRPQSGGVPVQPVRPSPLSPARRHVPRGHEGAVPADGVRLSRGSDHPDDATTATRPTGSPRDETVQRAAVLAALGGGGLLAGAALRRRP